MTINTITFSQFVNGGNLPTGVTTVGLSGGLNTYFNNPWVFLPPGSTADRPTPSISNYGLLRFNTDDQSYEYYDSVSSMWITLGSSSSTFIWSTVNTNTSMSINNGYFTNSASTIQLLLPAISDAGDLISIAGVGSGAGLWQIKQNAFQSVSVGTATTTVGTGGSLTSHHYSDSLNLVCSVSNTTWVSLGGPQTQGFTII